MSRRHRSRDVARTPLPNSTQTLLDMNKSPGGRRKSQRKRRLGIGSTVGRKRTATARTYPLSDFLGARPGTSTDTVDLDPMLVGNEENGSDDVFNQNMLNHVNKKVGVLGRGYLDSDDEDDIEPKTDATSSLILISDDSDEEWAVTRVTADNTLKPSNIADTNIKIPLEIKESKDPANMSITNILSNVEDLLGTTELTNTDSGIKDLKSLEEFRKETEEMLRNVTDIFGELKSVKPKEPEQKEVAPPEAEEVVVVRPCPVCLETMVGRPASVTLCGHIFCTPCIKQAARTLKSCPACRKHINLKKLHPIYF